MVATREMLEGEAYWGRIRSIKQKLYIFEAALIVVLGIVLILLAGDFQTSPFYVAIDMFLWFAMLMLFIIMIESFAFRSLQIRMAKTESTKHLMTINSMKRSFVILVVSAIVAIVFAAPTFVYAIEDSLSLSATATADQPHIFLTKDPVGLSRIESLDMISNLPATVYLVTEYQYNTHPDDWTYLRGSAFNQGETLVDPDLMIEMPNLKHMYLYLLVDPNASDDGAVVDISLNRELSGTLTAFLPMIAAVFLIANAVWVAYLWPLRKKYASGSIYK